MPAFNYQQRFADQVQSGTKRSTIRRWRKRPIYIGDTLYHYTGLRTPGCHKIGNTTCIRVREIRITPGGTIKIDGQVIYRESAQALAKADGFNSLADFIQFFCPGEQDFHGQLIEW